MFLDLGKNLGTPGAPHVAPMEPPIHLGMVLKSVTISKQGRRNGFFKGSPLGFPNFYQGPKTSLGPSRNSLKSFS